MTPPNGTLGINESAQITVQFKPVTVGDHQSDLVIRYDTGKIKITLFFSLNTEF